MKLFIKPLLAALLLWTCAAPAPATQADSGAAQTSVPWLSFPDSARSAGMGGAFGAMGEDLTSLGLNPAALDQLAEPQILLMHNAWFQGVSMEHLAAGLPLDSGSGLGFSVDYLNAGLVDSYIVSGNVPVPNGTLSPDGWQGTLGLGLAVSRQLDLGLAGHYIRQDLGGPSGDAFAATAGALVHGFLQGVYLGAAAENLGGKLQGADLPEDLKLSAAYKSPSFGKIHSFNLAADADFPLADSQAAQLSLGVEYWYRGILALRAGDQISDGIEATGANGFTFGAGLNLGAARLDYAYMSNGSLGSSNLVSLVLRAGGPPQARLTAGETEILADLRKNVQFAFDQAGLAPSFARQLDQLGDLLVKRPWDRVVLTGYASQEGSADHNLKLSLERSAAVKARLLSRGVPESQVATLGKGDSNPLVATTPGGDLGPNRRVEITILQVRPGQN